MPRPPLRILAPLLPLCLLALAAGGLWLASRNPVPVPAPSGTDADHETVLEFRHLQGARLEEGAERPTYSAFLAALDGRPVVIAGHMRRFDSDTRFKQFVLTEHAPDTTLAPPAAGEVVFVEQAGSNLAPEGSYPPIDGLISVRGILRLTNAIPPNPGLQEGYWFAIEEAVVDQLGPP